MDSKTIFKFSEFESEILQDFKTKLEALILFHERNFLL